MASKERNVALDYLKTAKPRSSAHKVLSQDDFLGGLVAHIQYSDNGEEIKQWVVVTGKHKGYADSESQLIQQLQTASNKEGVEPSWATRVFNISGLIALILVGASVYLTVTTPGGDVPEHLKASVLTVVGFYFGGLSKSARAKTGG